MYHSSKIDYSRRTVDMLLLQTVLEPSSDIIVKPNVTSNPRIVTGIEKLAQRFALLFLTQIGTVENSGMEGTDFLTLLGTGRIYDQSTLQSAAYAAVASVLRQIRAADTDLDTPPDEKLSSASVVDLSISRSASTVSIKVKLTAESGDTYTYITPIEAGV